MNAPKIPKKVLGIGGAIITVLIVLWQFFGYDFDVPEVEVETDATEQDTEQDTGQDATEGTGNVLDP